MKTAILIIEVQNDFFERGVLPAKDTLSLVKPLNEAIGRAMANSMPCVYTRDWHPANHCSFVAQGGTWPQHCVQNSAGACFADGLIVSDNAIIIDIETEPFENNARCSAFENTELLQVLERLQIETLIVTGIATDYSVKTTVLDAMQLGFTVIVLTDLVRSIDIKPNDSAKALEEMNEAGATMMTSNTFFIHLEMPL
jgi:nicotinamidase/pyrazinamidase